jgi:hypothetical protein
LGVAAQGQNMIAKGEINHGTFFIYATLAKHSFAGWNTHGEDVFGVFLDSMAVPVALQLATGSAFTYDEVTGTHTMTSVGPGYGDYIPDLSQPGGYKYVGPGNGSFTPLEGGSDKKYKLNYDPFFSPPFTTTPLLYGTGPDGIPKWPSLQFARWGLDMEFIWGLLYGAIVEYATATGKTFEFYIPDSVHYIPLPGVSYMPPPDPRIIQKNPSDPDYAEKVFTVVFNPGLPGEEVW